MDFQLEKKRLEERGQKACEKPGPLASVRRTQPAAQNHMGMDQGALRASGE